MGARLSVRKRDVCHQVKTTLVSGKGEFSKPKLKSFVKWLCLAFPNLTILSLVSLDFWDEVGKTLSSRVKSGDGISSEYLHLFLLISGILESQGAKRLRKLGGGTPILPSPSSLPCPSYSPSPTESLGACAPAPDASVAARRPQNPPVAPRSPLRGPDQPPGELRSPPTPTPRSPVAPVAPPKVVRFIKDWDNGDDLDISSDEDDGVSLKDQRLGQNSSSILRQKDSLLSSRSTLGRDSKDGSRSRVDLDTVGLLQCGKQQRGLCDAVRNSSSGYLVINRPDEMVRDFYTPQNGGLGELGAESSPLPSPMMSGSKWHGHHLGSSVLSSKVPPSGMGHPHLPPTRGRALSLGSSPTRGGKTKGEVSPVFDALP